MKRARRRKTMKFRKRTQMSGTPEFGEIPDKVILGLCGLASITLVLIVFGLARML